MGWPLQPDLLIRLRIDEHAARLARQARARALTHGARPTKERHAPRR